MMSGSSNDPSPHPSAASRDAADVIVVGSGFGGAVAALRLAEQGRRVLVLEQGRRHTPEDLLAARSDPRKYLWMPELGLRGFFWQRVLRHVGIIGGAGVGGGSIVWAGVLLEPKEEFFTDSAWPEVADGWRAQLTEHYRTAARMLGRETTRFVGEMDRHLETTAEKMGAAQTYGPTPMAIWFGAPGEEGVTVPAPTRRPSPRFWPTIRTPISPEARPSPASSIRTRPPTSPRTGTSAAGTCGCNSARWSTVRFPPGGGARRWRSSAATRSGSSG
ncbi:FAD-binding protein [Gordonia rubripertincta]|uniref:FAD-binding protein n=1 Tax=Gordonia rubripertincta TaxID=36822 RepID=UPI0021B12711|nr:FAD-binding protein [Gordonia rubripertincta]